MKTAFFSYLAILLSAAVLIAPITHSAQPSTTDTRLAVEDVGLRIPALMESADIHGLTIAVVENGDLAWSDAFGMASAELDRTATTETMFEAASLGKVVFSLITLRLAEQGLIQLDESIADNFDYPILDHDERFTQLTPRLILQHAAGLPNWGSYALAEVREPAQFRENPGKSFNYSGEAYTALQTFIEARAGRNLEELFKELAVEAGMKNSSFISFNGPTEKYAQAWRSDGTERQIMRFDNAGAAYSLISTAEDLARFTDFYFQHASLSETLFNESILPLNPVAPGAWGSFIPNGASISWALGWGVLETEDENIYFHAGNNGEFRSFYAYSPKRNIGAAVMTNGANGLSFLSEIFTPFVGNIRPASVWWGYE